MKQILLKTWLIIACLLVGVGTSWSEEVTITFNPSTDQSFPKDGITISVTGGTLTNGTDYRVYKNEKMTISSTVGNITKIALTYSNASYDGGGWQASYQPDKNTWTSPTANGEQARITKLVVTVSSDSSTPTTYNVNIPDNIANGTISANPTSAKGGDEVSLTANPATGYEFGSWNVTNASTNEVITVTDNKFTMPAADVNVSATFNQNQGGGDEPSGDDDLAIDFEDETSAYTAWTFTNITSKQTNSNVTAHGGSYYGDTDGKATGYIQTKEKIAKPNTITFYISKETTNTTSSSWKIQTSTNETSWTDVKTVSASSVTRGEWTEVTQSLTAYSDVYIRIYYNGSTAVRCIDDVTLTLKSKDDPETETCQTPQFSIQTGTYSSSQSVTLTSGTEGASIYYTLDGTDPSTSSTLYTGVINITETTTVKAIAAKEGCEDSEIAEATYTIVSLEGEGTQDNPYTLSDVANLNNPGTVAWVIGYIRGSYKSATELKAPSEESNLALSETSDGTTYYPVGLKNNTEPRADLNVVDHKENVGHQIKVKGTLTAYFSTTGVKDITEYAWVGDAPTPDEKTLSSIAVKTAPTKVTYTEGDKFDPTGLVITATYSDESTEDVAYADHASDFTFDPSLTTTLATTNNSVTITYGGKSATQTITVNAAASIANTKETAYTVAEAVTLIDEGKGLSTPVYVKGTVSRIYSKSIPAGGGYIDYFISADGTTEGQQFELFHNYKGANNEIWAALTDVTVGDQVIAYGILTKYDTTYELAQGNYLVSHIKSTPTKTTPILSFANPTYNATKGEAFEVPALNNPQNVTVSYSSSETGVATVNATTGAITLVGAGTTVITAAFDGTDNDTYDSNSASYTLVVKEATTPEPGDITPGTYDIAINNALWGTEENGTYNGTIPETLTGTQNGVTITFNKGEGANLYINDTETRIYAKEELVVSVPDGYSITSIVNTSDSKKSATITTTPTGYDNGTKTWTGNAQSVAFSVNDANGFQTLTVTFAQGGVTPEPTPDHGTINFVASNNDGYWATFSSTKDVIFPADGDIIPELVAVIDNQILKTDISDESWTMVTDPNVSDQEGIWGYYIPAGTGVLLYSTEISGTYYFVKEYEWNQKSTIDPSYNMLVPCTETAIFKAEADGNYYYKLAYDDYTQKTNLGFWWGANNGSGNFKVKAGGAILCVPQSAGIKGFSFDMMVNNETVIEKIENNRTCDAIYNLQGVKLQKLQKGINIVNGRKVIR